MIKDVGGKLDFARRPSLNVPTQNETPRFLSQCVATSSTHYEDDPVTAK